MRKKADFLSWTPEEFRRQAAAAAEDNPEYREILDEFCAYWIAEDRRGGPHFRHMETWSMAGRLATWARKRREETARRPVVLHPAELTPEEAGRMIEEAQRA